MRCSIGRRSSRAKRCWCSVRAAASGWPRSNSGKLAGARVIAAASSEEKLAAARTHGADELINYSTANLREAIKAADGRHGRDVIYDPVGGPLTEAGAAFDRLARPLPGRRFRAGRDPADRGQSAAAQRGIGGGRLLGRLRQREPQANAAMLTELFSWLVQGKLKPHVSWVATLAETPKVLEALLQRKVVGKVVIRPA